ncbi:ligand-binding protein SH3 [Bacillus pseudomycoides]|uniref:Ligand-binding protein SH3 n=1 Tax=Bacillus pseudomycoides TaxID=64104 RepID=A0AA91VEM3_9BACI|nr:MULTISPECIES: multidrug efflux SMR transporter [Bacillus]PEB56501.1 ligand-binding protein SH3 [Bacillus sp. AFS098217]PED83586.1 ligand-binding protein SH3 [Bacillus pseudomycoides]PEU12043.1 ligand-binding protein SH3 [Bacillus sp. AFS019443]PEU20238.1 ligand-binding protein SH3 [Bacillus sp. AFS014408]PFW63900.1 ligand-binding protein SH3 [Bacillus sp. AFS075034]
MKNKAWLYVILTCIFEVFWVFGFNTAHEWWHWAIIVGIIFVDFHMLSKACENLATGTVYAVFAGVGTVGTFLMDVFLFGGSFSLGKLFFIVMIVAGVIGLKLADNKEVGEEEVMKGAA